MIIEKPLIILLVAVPLIIQTYFIFFIAWFGGRFLKLPHPVCAPAALIGASNFFGLAYCTIVPNTKLDTSSKSKVPAGEKERRGNCNVCATGLHYLLTVQD